MPATFRQLEVFLAVHKFGSFAKAAYHLDISQAAVSRHIAALEKSLGKTLFSNERGRSARLSAVGLDYVVSARTLLTHSEVIGFKSGLGAEKPVRVRVGADTVILNTIFTPANLSLTYKGRPIDIVFDRLDDLGDANADISLGLCDLAYFTFPETCIDTEGSELVARNEAGLYAAPQLAQRWRDNPDDPLPVIFPIKDTPLANSAERIFEQEGITNYVPVAYVASEHAFELALSGVGAFFRGCRRAQPFVDSGLLIELDDFMGRHFVGRYVVRTRNVSDAVRRVEGVLSALVVAVVDER